MKLSVVPCLLLLLTGCVNPMIFFYNHQNVSHDSRFATDYIVGATYRVQRTLAVRSIDNELMLCSPERNLELQDVIKDEQQHSSKDNFFVGLVPTGTLLVVSKLDLREGFEESIVWVLGRCVDGPFAGKSVNLSSVSNPGVSKTGWAEVSCVDTNTLQLVNKP